MTTHAETLGPYTGLLSVFVEVIIRWCDKTALPGEGLLLVLVSG